MSEVLLEISHMKKAFNGQEVLKDISLSVSQGEVVSIIGPSGGGKSTLLRCATMLETMDGGSLRYLDRYAAREEDGHCVYASAQELREIGRMFGLVFQNFNLFPHYTVLKNITEPQLLSGTEGAQAEKRARDLLTDLGLSDKADAYPFQLSGGQQQRVSIARALALGPKILFFDEPTSALDPELTGEVLRVIRQLADEHMTMIIVTHEMQFAKELSDRIIFLEHGCIEAEGTPEELFSSGNARVSDFVGRFRL
ncbi:MAG: amino acid ABC transporter ATP-binding protein [Lachnospiraceae bacterium]|jgi:polar amino acid transport system ATP-binding protein|nr:amino acid ABC transporter ATP-binding protein [Lachnospiraceae bacterium]